MLGVSLSGSKFKEVENTQNNFIEMISPTCIQVVLNIFIVFWTDIGPGDQ